MLSNSKGLSTVFRSPPYLPSHIGTPNLTIQYYNATLKKESNFRPSTVPSDSISSSSSKPIARDGDENKRRNSVETILLKREAARIKYQQLLLKRSSSFQSSPNQVIEMSKSSREDYNDLSRIDTDLSRIDTDRSSIRSLGNESRDEDDTFLQENHDSNKGESSKEILVPFHPKIRSDFVRNQSKAYKQLVTTVFRTVDKRNESINFLSADFHRQDNKIKSGVLKSMSFMNIGQWVDKTVEISPGILTYYEDVGDVQTCVRSKSIHLIASLCECNITNIKQREKTLFPEEGAIFEIKTSNSPIQYWMSSSYQEMLDWVYAIKFAIVGRTRVLKHEEDENNPSGEVRDSLTIDRNIPSVLERNNADVVCFLHVRDLCIQATSAGEYKHALALIQDKTLRIPLKWLRRYIRPSFHPKNGKRSTSSDKLWKDMETEEVIINGKLIRGDSIHGVERIISTMTSYIRDMDRFGAKLISAEKPFLKESQAVFYTRDIMSCCNRENSGVQSRFCVERLCENKSLAHVVQSPSDADPIEFFLSPSPRNNNLIEGNEFKHNRPPSGKSSGLSLMKRPSTAPVQSSRKIVFQNHKKHAQDRNIVRSDDFHSPSTSTVEISSRVSNIYRICNVDRINGHAGETWGLVRTHFLQKFWISGSQAELIDDDAIVEITFAV